MHKSDPSRKVINLSKHSFSLDTFELLNNNLISYLQQKSTIKSNYCRVPNNRPPQTVNFSIFFHPGHLYDTPPPPPPIINLLPFLLIFLSVNGPFHHSPSQSKRNGAVLHNYYESRKHEIHVVSVRSHRGYVYSINKHMQ